MSRLNNSTFVSFKLIAREPFKLENVALVLSNSFVFYGYGYAILDGDPSWREYLGLFTVANAFVHFLVAVAAYRLTSAEPGVVNLLVGLVIVFITIAVPVQVDANWITLVWTAEAVVRPLLRRSVALSRWWIVRASSQAAGRVAITRRTVRAMMFGVSAHSVICFPLRVRTSRKDR